MGSNFHYLLLFSLIHFLFSILDILERDGEEKKNMCVHHCDGHGHGHFMKIDHLEDVQKNHFGMFIKQLFFLKDS